MTGGHGHVPPRQDGAKARCGGPRMCTDCARELTTRTTAAPEQIAAEFHGAYERLAPAHGYKTREASAVPWADVPDANKTLMIAVAQDLLQRGIIARGDHLPAPSAETPEERQAREARFANAEDIFHSLPRHVLQRLIAESYPIIPRESSPEEITCFIADRAIEQGLVSTDKKRQP